MQKPANELTGLIDIEAPFVPHDGWDFLWPLVGGGVLLLLTFIVVRIIFSNKHKTNAALRKLYGEYKKETIGKRSTLFRLVEILKSRMMLQRTSVLELPIQLTEDSLSRWQEFIVELESARYAKQEAEIEQIEALFAEARYWMKQF